MNDLEKLCPKFLQTPNAAGIIAFLFNEFMDLEMRMAVPDAVAQQIGQYMQAYGYGIVFNKFYKQREEQILESVTHAQPVQPAGAQEPVGHFVFNQENGYWVQIDKQVWPNGSPISERLYKQAPVSAINEQLLEALKMVLDDPQALDGRPRTAECVMEAIRAAEAEKAKGGV